VEICPSCGAEQGPDARFCANCGALQHPLRDEQQERRVVTVLFSDLAGSTALAAEALGGAAARERELGFAFDAACLALDHARAFDTAGRAEEAVLVRTEAEEFLWALDCVNAF
jgi:ribosomal protein L40E